VKKSGSKLSLCEKLDKLIFKDKYPLVGLCEADHRWRIHGDQNRGYYCLTRFYWHPRYWRVIFTYGIPIYIRRNIEWKSIRWYYNHLKWRFRRSIRIYILGKPRMRLNCKASWRTEKARHLLVEHIKTKFWGFLWVKTIEVVAKTTSYTSSQERLTPFNTCWFDDETYAMVDVSLCGQFQDMWMYQESRNAIKGKEPIF